jgi:hypothetical protein
MPPQEPAGAPAALLFYVERNLAIDDFVRWATGVHLSTRLRSVIGPPGSGKTTFLLTLHHILGQHNRCFLLPILFPDSARNLQEWLDSVLAQGGRQFEFTPIPSNEPQEVFRQLCSHCGANIPVLFLDAFEELPVDERRWIEEHLLIPFLHPNTGGDAKTRIIVARREERALEEALLRWEEEVHPLEGLDKPAADGPVEQVRQRLAAVLGKTWDQAKATLEWPNAPDDAIDYAIVLNRINREALLETLRGLLTPSPYVNLLLLQRKLAHPTTPLTGQDYDECLKAYVRRAGVPAQYARQVKALIRSLPDPHSFTVNHYDARGDRNAVLQALMAAGIVFQIPKTSSYGFEPAFIQLIERSGP